MNMQKKNPLEKILRLKQICKTCKKEFNSGIWLSPQFPGERVLLFCSNKCKAKYLAVKLRRIKIAYPKFYKKLKNQNRKGRRI